MNVQRFVASNSREAMSMARAALGDSAVILSSRTTEEGFEVLAATEEGLAGIGRQQAGESVVKVSSPQRGGTLQQRAARQLPPNAELAARVTPNSTVAQDTETMAMSTLSFQDYVRERMLRKRREAMEAAAAPKTTVAAPTKESNMTLPFAQQAAAANRPANKAAAPAPKAAKAHAPQTDARLLDEFNSLKAMMEERFNTLAWLGAAKQDPIQSGLMLKLIRAGYSPTVARAIMERLPADYNAADAFRWVQEVLVRNLKTSRDASALCDEGGVFALIGSTGVGKTTTAAKLAAQCVKAYGANSVGLITLDTYRVAGYEQLRTYGRMLGVVAHLAHDLAALQDLLALLANKRMVIIDTAGLGQKDPRIQEMMEMLATPKIKKLLVLNAGSHGDTLDEVFNAYKETSLHGVVLSKLDEAAKLGPAVDALIRHQVVLRGVSTGQRVPEDWQRPDAQALVRMSMASSGKSAHDPQTAELPFFFTAPVQTGVQLDGWHA